jgi:hypothetical protein
VTTSARLLPLTLGFVFLVALPAQPAAAQGPPERPQNLQVLPKDIPRDTLLRIMRGVATSLGVRCDFCHVAREGAAPAQGGPPQLDFASDAKVEKKNARYMMRMTRDINVVALAGLPRRSDPPVQVQCVTCHRGLSKPATLGGILASTIERAGVDSAVAQYRALRQSDALSGRYDFSEQTVTELAQQRAVAGKTDEALALLQLNQEFYPSSAAIDLALGDVYRQRGEKDKAIVSYRAALVKQPGNRQARQRLTELGAP